MKGAIATVQVFTDGMAFGVNAPALGKVPGVVWVRKRFVAESEDARLVKKALRHRVYVKHSAHNYSLVANLLRQSRISRLREIKRLQHLDRCCGGNGSGEW